MAHAKHQSPCECCGEYRDDTILWKDDPRDSNTWIERTCDHCHAVVCEDCGEREGGDVIGSAITIECSDCYQQRRIRETRRAS